MTILHMHKSSKLHVYLCSVMIKAMKDLTFDDLESWLNLNEEKSFTTIVVGTISVGERHKCICGEKIHA